MRKTSKYGLKVLSILVALVLIVPSSTLLAQNTKTGKPLITVYFHPS